LAALRAERDALAARVALLEREQSESSRRASAQRLVAASGLPEFAATASFVEQLASTEDEGGRVRLIAERRELVARCSAAGPRSAERRGLESRDSTAAFVAAIRGGRKPTEALRTC
jgi:hypothetical protein